MAIYFGTDGMRGVYGEELTPNLVYKCGNSLSRFCAKGKVLIGRDTRTSGDNLTLSFASGLTGGGVDVFDVGVVPTPAVAYLCKKLDCDYGIVISASHNPAKFNGVKIYDSQGYKISEEMEKAIERKLFTPRFVNFDKLGVYKQVKNKVKLYKDDLIKDIPSLKGMKIVLDCANGACKNIAKEVFSRLGAEIILLCNGEGKDINNLCGALYPEKMQRQVLQSQASMGFSFDGDGDRIVCSDEKGNILDGDDILFLLACSMKECKGVVGTTMSNKGFENALAKKKIPFFRADVGDKYVAELMRSKSLPLGGEPSGHIIIHSLSTTGDGILCALNLAKLVKQKQKPLSKLVSYKKFPQVNINLPVIDKYRILNSDRLSSETLEIQKLFGQNGRVLVRASGTESKIRIMCEHISRKIAQEKANKLEEIVLELNKTQKN